MARDKYTFRVETEVKDKFKMYCKMMNISPSAILSEVMVNFNDDVDKIIQMQNIEELQELVKSKFVQANEEINFIQANKK